jgi:ketosteroid isomerase-like protein
MVPGTKRPSSTLVEELSAGDPGCASTSVSADVASSGAAHQAQNRLLSAHSREQEGQFRMVVDQS